MGFDSGAVAFRLFYLSESYDSSIVEAFARHAAPPITSLDRDPITGWVTGKHLLDRTITEESCVFGPYVSVQLMKAEKKIPNSLLRAYVKLEEEVEKKARNVAELPRAVKSEIREHIIAQFLPQMPPTLTGIPVMTDLRNQIVLASAMSDKQHDAFCVNYRTTVGELPVAVTPESAAAKRKRINPIDLDPVRFTPDETVELVPESALGMDFLTWLWFYWEKEGGVFQADGFEHGLMLEGPLYFFREGEGAHEVVLRNGVPMNSKEAGVALLCGKKLRRAKITLTRGDWVVSANVDDSFAFRAVKLPKPESEDAYGKFQERMMFIEMFWTAWLALYDKFLDTRCDSKAWPKTVSKMGQWILERARSND